MTLFQELTKTENSAILGINMPPFFCPSFRRRPPISDKSAWQTSLPPFFVCRLIALQIPVSGLCGDCLALLGCASGAHARRSRGALFASFGDPRGYTDIENSSGSSGNFRTELSERCWRREKALFPTWAGK